MPYIAAERRASISVLVDSLLTEIDTVGDVNYTISRLIHKVLEKENLTYASINSMIGVLECAKLELYRQIAAPYEDEKKKIHGSVSLLDY